MKLNTPTAILIGLTLIAGAIFFRPPVISKAYAGDIHHVYLEAIEGSIDSVASAIEGIRACRN